MAIDFYERKKKRKNYKRYKYHRVCDFAKKNKKKNWKFSTEWQEYQKRKKKKCVKYNIIVCDRHFKRVDTLPTRLLKKKTNKNFIRCDDESIEYPTFRFCTHINSVKRSCQLFVNYWVYIFIRRCVLSARENSNLSPNELKNLQI